jgi:Ca-activated chloride channel homolog
VILEHCDKHCCKMSLYADAMTEDNHTTFRMLIPLKEVSIIGFLEAGVANLNVVLSYQNTSVNTSLNMTFEFPLE